MQDADFVEDSNIITFPIGMSMRFIVTSHTISPFLTLWLYHRIKAKILTSEWVRRTINV